MSTNLDQLTDWLKEHKITEVECLISDLTGITRGKDFADQQVHRRKGMRLPESVLLQTVTGDYVDDDIYYQLLDPADIDMICRPDERCVPRAMGHRADRPGHPRHLRQEGQSGRAVAAQRAQESPEAVRRQRLAADRGA